MSENFRKYMFLMDFIGKIKNADIVYEYKSNSCSDNFTLYIKLDDDKETIQDIKYQIFGCPGLMAGCSSCCSLVLWRDVKKIKSIEDNDIFRILGDFPEEYKKCSLTMLNVLRNEIFCEK